MRLRAWLAALPVAVLVACGSPTTPSERPGDPPPSEGTGSSTTTTGQGGGKPSAKGSPVRKEAIERVGRSYAEHPTIKETLAQACGGKLCITVREVIDGPPTDPEIDCEILRINQSPPFYRGDTITVVLADPCGESRTTSSTTSTTSRTTTTPPTETSEE